MDLFIYLFIYLSLTKMDSVNVCNQRQWGKELARSREIHLPPIVLTRQLH